MYRFKPSSLIQYSPSPETPSVACETTSSLPPSHAVAYKTHAEQDTATQQPPISSSLTFATNLPSSFVTHSFLYPSPTADAHVIVTHPQPPPPPLAPHITSAIPSHQPIATPNQGNLDIETTLAQQNATRLQQPQPVTRPLPSEFLTYVFLTYDFLHMWTMSRSIMIMTDSLHTSRRVL